MKTIKNIEHRHALAGSGQTGILAKYPDIVDEIKVQLQGLRTSGLAVNILVVCLIMLVIIQQQQQQLLHDFK